ncbi:MAG: glycoside hydrolase family 3 C-terminal domain-containing protein, partial [Bacteroidaceae bacterium]|nr:glycoside hydrolase family 3 C-terminal domain-containing protein [Bacteroidaceae bacterium]
THDSPLSAAVDAVLNGTDLDCGKVCMVLTEALEKGLISEAELDKHLRRTLSERFRLGMFDPAEMIPWSKLGPETISSEKNDATATQAARESMVLLHNNGVLPLSKSLKTIAVIGPNAADAGMLNGNYGGTPTEEHTHTLLDGIKAAVPGANIIYQRACELNQDNITVSYIDRMNNGQGFKAEFFENNKLEGQPAKTDYTKQVRFSTFGAWGFAEGVSSDNISVRLTGSFKADYTGDMSYNISSDNGYLLKVKGSDGSTFEKKGEAGQGGRGGFGGFGGFGRGRGVQYETFKVQNGVTYDVTIEYNRGTGQFASLNAEICQNKLVDFVDVKEAVKNADVIICIGGISARMEGEGGDKQTIELPTVQQRMVRAMHETGKPVVFVNCSGSAIAFGSVEGQYDALLQAWYPGQGGAKALAEVLFGDYNPSGKLPITFYRSNDDLPEFTDYSMDNRTYRYFRGQPQYAFGYGLSYTTFSVGQAKISAKSMKKDGKVTITVPVTNTGKRTGNEVVQVYVKALDYAEAPIKDLRGFQKIELAAGKTGNAQITLDGEAFQYYDPSIDELSTRPGRYQILYGTSSLDKDLKSLDFVVK